MCAVEDHEVLECRVKLCVECNKILPIEEFPDKTRRLCATHYRAMRRAEKKAYKKAHPEKVKEEKRRYKRAHPEKTAEDHRIYQQNHPEKVRIYAQKYNQTHNGFKAVWNENRRSRKSMTDGTFTFLESDLLYKQFNNSCAFCGVELTDERGSKNGKTLDHIVPLCDGGTNYIWNLIPACRSCNCKKNGKNFLLGVWSGLNWKTRQRISVSREMHSVFLSCIN